MRQERLAYLKRISENCRIDWERRTILDIQIPEEPKPQVEGENVVQLPRQPAPIFSLGEVDIYIWDGTGEKCQGVFRIKFIECERHIIFAWPDDAHRPDTIDGPIYTIWALSIALEMDGAPVRDGTEWHLLLQEGVKASEWKDKPDTGPIRRRNTRRYEDGWDLMAAAPQDGRIIMVAWARGEFDYTFARYNVRRGKWVDAQSKKPFTLPPSHWRPLPQPPVHDPD